MNVWFALLHQCPLLARPRRPDYLRTAVAAAAWRHRLVLTYLL